MEITFAVGDKNFYRVECPSEAGLWPTILAKDMITFTGLKESVIRYISSLPADAKYSVKEG